MCHLSNVGVWRVACRVLCGVLLCLARCAQCVVCNELCIGSVYVGCV